MTAGTKLPGYTWEVKFSLPISQAQKKHNGGFCFSKLQLGGGAGTLCSTTGAGAGWKTES